MEWLNQNAAAIQVVGTLFAIAIAIWVPFNIHSNETSTREREIRLKGQAIALLIDPLLRAIDGEIESKSLVHEAGSSPIEIPDTILSLSRDLWLMGESGGNVLQLIGILQAHNSLLEQTISLPIDMEKEERREFARIFHERLNLARECLRDALAAIDVLLVRKA